MDIFIAVQVGGNGGVRRPAPPQVRNIETIDEIRKIGARGFYLYKKTYLCNRIYFFRRSHIRELRILGTGRKENKRQKKDLTRHLETSIL